jgi:hypothetical protein
MITINSVARASTKPGQILVVVRPLRDGVVIGYTKAR